MHRAIRRLELQPSVCAAAEAGNIRIQEAAHAVGALPVGAYHIGFPVPDEDSAHIPIDLAQGGLGGIGDDVIIVHQHVHHAVDGGTAGHGDARRAQDLGFLGVCAHIDAVCAVAGQGLDRAAARRGNNALCQLGANIVVLHHGQAGDAHGAARPGQGHGARARHGEIAIIGFQNGVPARDGGDALGDIGMHAAAFRQHLHIAREGSAGDAARQRSARQDAGVVAAGLGIQITARGQIAVGQAQFGLAVKHVHVEAAADAHIGAQRRRQGGVEHPGVVVGLQFEVARFGCDVGRAAQGGIGGGLGHDDVHRARAGFAGGGGRRRGGQDAGNQLIGDIGRNADIAARGDGIAIAQGGGGLGLVHDDVHGAARGHFAGARRHVGAAGDQHQVILRLAVDLRAAARGQGGVIADGIAGRALIDDHVDGSAHSRRGIGARGDRHGGGERLDVAGLLGTMGNIAGSGDLGVVAGHGLSAVAVHQHGHGGAHAGLGRGGGQAARDDASGGAVGGVHIHVSVLGFDDHVIAQGRPDNILGDGHGEGARQIGLGFACGHRARDGFGIGVLAGQEVEGVRGVQQLFGGQVHIHGIAVLVLALVHVDEARVGLGPLLIVQGAGIGNQIAHVNELLEIVVGDGLLFSI